MKKLLVKSGETKNLLLNSLNTTEVNLKENSELTMVLVLENEFISQKEMIFKLEGKNANLKLLAIIIGKNSEKFPLKITAIHSSPETKSEITIKSVLKDESEINFEGKIIVPKKSVKTVSHLSHNSLPLSENAKTITIPSLEIHENNVKISHSTTIGLINSEHLFYLKSRGINQETAEKILIKAFVLSDLKNFNDKHFANKIRLPNL